MKYLLLAMLLCVAGCSDEKEPSEAEMQKFRTYQDAKYQLLDKENAVARSAGAQKLLEESSTEYQTLAASIAQNKTEIEKLKVIVDEYERNRAASGK